MVGASVVIGATRTIKTSDKKDYAFPLDKEFKVGFAYHTQTPDVTNFH